MRAITAYDLKVIDYYQVPKWLMNLFISGRISSGAFKTYILMYDRLRVSAKNNWIDKEGNVYIKYSYDELMKDLNCNSKTTVSNNLKDLQKLDLIDKVKCFSSSNIYYLRIISTEDCTSTENYSSTESCTPSSTEKCTTVSTESCTPSSTENLYASKNNSSKNNISKNNYSKNNNAHKVLEELEKEYISYELKEKLKEFITYRKEIKKPIKTYTVISKLLGQIGTKYINEEHLMLSIDDSIANQYQGVFPVKITKPNNKSQNLTPAMQRLNELTGGN